MESQVCVHCLNKKVINSTTNRLVTESCGHVKCMDCLVHEKAGCVACTQESSGKEVQRSGSSSVNGSEEREPVRTDFPLKHFLLGGDVEKEADKTDRKKKLETSHIRIETDGNQRYYLCTACKRRFQARSQVSYHAYCNGQEKPYQCPECSKSFATHSHFKYHMRVHRGERTYVCECGEGFFQMSKLQRHRLQHTKEKKYSCPECSKAFNNLSSLRKHSLTHSDERPYGCDTCGRRFRDSSNYRKHVAKHNGGGCARGRRRARAHVCPRCPQAFHARKDMRRHAQVHTDLKPFRCRVCSRRFRRKDNLERHVRNTHPAAAEPGNEKVDPKNEKTKLESLNPLPPLPPEVIQQHMHEDKQIARQPPTTLLSAPDRVVEQTAMKIEQTTRTEQTTGTTQTQTQTQTPTQTPGPEQRSLAEILAANTARQSVIFGPVRRREPEPSEYVHKIRKANRRLPLLLPPIDERKILQLEQLGMQNNLDVGAPPEKFRELYKKILYERSEKEAALAADEQHWKKKKLNTNWYQKRK